MKEFITKYRQFLLNALTVLLVLISLINFYFIFEIVPQSNDECLWQEKTENDTTKIFFNNVKFEGVTWEAGIRDNDILKAINGIRTTDNFKATVILNSLKAGEYAEYTIERDGYEFKTKVYIKKLLNFSGLGIALLSFFWLLAGYLVITARPEGKIQRKFYIVGVLFCLASLSTIKSGTIGQNPVFEYKWLTILLDIIITVGSVYLPFKILEFFWIFPHEFKFANKKITKRLLRSVPAYYLIVLLALKYYYVYREIYDNLNHFKYLFIPGMILGIALAAGLISLFINYMKLSDKKERNSIFIILVSYAIGVAAIVYTNFFANVLAENVFNNPEYYTPIILVALLPISFGYSIFRYSLMDVSDVVKNTITYGAATISIASVYFFTIYIIGQIVSSAFTSEYQGIVAGIVFITFAFIFQSTKNKFQDIITERFYPEQFAYQKVLIDFSNQISGIVGLENILDEVQDTFLKYLKINRFGIVLKNEEINECKLVRAKGIDKNLKIKFSGDILSGYIISKMNFKQPIAVSSHQFTDILPDIKDKLTEQEIFTVIPLVIKNKVIGLFLFGLKYSGAQFAGKDLDLLCAAANQTATSIENARLYEAEAQKIKMERDLENARRIQQNLLPLHIPEIKNLDISGRMIPAMHIGGDYYDVIKLDDARALVVIGDVSGKGLPASFYMSKLQTMVRLYSKTITSPRNILQEINKGIFGEIDRNTFITVSIALIDTETGTIRFCRAGHTELLIAGSRIEFIKSKGIGVGLEGGEVFDSFLEEKVIKLEKNSVLLFFSDGVSEAMNSENELFGNERIEAAVSGYTEHTSREILEYLVESVNCFSGEAEQTDDITAVVIKYSGN